MKIEEYDTVPVSRAGRNTENDKAFQQILAAQKNACKVSEDGKDSRDMYQIFKPRVKKYNKDPNRAFDLRLSTRNKETWIEKTRRV